MRPTIAFDLDGTLVDTAPDLLRALDFALEHEGLNPPEDHEARNFIGSGARAMIERALAYSQVQFGKEKVDGMFRQFLAHYEQHIADHSRPFPGVEQALARLAGEGALLAVCTNKLEAYAVKLLRELNLAERFDFIAGSDTFPYKKPDPRHLTGAIERAGGTIERAVLVGDSETDVITAKAAEIPVVAVSFGYTDIPPAALGADRLVHKFEEVPAAAMDLIAVRRLA
ncbi:MAG: phosphoglycolate phosphatase [Xanthobacteraceae bacterium]|nr:phosphoglycolate phosphatase [Xanthobacteraceae bacterium]MBX3535176.1 phosphoglycolate phosphatase [Xanthobacteraceae bacterium]MCW5677987.1 phosphoglycolate phosphatase [Xanthobacteraceae bacterium]